MKISSTVHASDVMGAAKEKALKLLIQTLQTRADETHNIIQGQLLTHFIIFLTMYTALQSAFGLHEAAVVDEDAGIEAVSLSICWLAYFARSVTWS